MRAMTRKPSVISLFQQCAAPEPHKGGGGPLRGNDNVGASNSADRGAVGASRPSSALPSWVLKRASEGGMRSFTFAPDLLAPSVDYLTVRELAGVLRVSERTVRRHVADGRIPHIRVGRQIRIPRAKLVEGA